MVKLLDGLGAFTLYVPVLSTMCFHKRERTTEIALSPEALAVYCPNGFLKLKPIEKPTSIGLGLMGMVVPPKALVFGRVTEMLNQPPIAKCDLFEIVSL